MIAGDTFYLAARNLRQAKLRTALTTMGVAIGIASLAGMVSLGVGLQEQLVGRFMQSGLFDVVTVTSPSSLPVFGPGGRANRGPRGGRGGAGGRGASASAATNTPATPETPAKPLDDAAIAELAAIPNVRDVAPNVFLPLTITLDSFTTTTAGRGVPLSAGADSVFHTPKYGAFFPNATDRTCILNADFAQRMTEGDPKDLIGREVTLTYVSGGSSGGLISVPQVKQNELKYKIVGIIERETGPGAIAGIGISSVMIPLPQALAIDRELVTGVQQLLRPSDGTNKKTYSSITIRVAKAQATKDVEDAVKKAGFSAFSLNDALEGAKRAFIILDIVLSLIGSIALAVSSLGIMNTMVMSILERTREIGIMKAIGGSDGDIRRIFLVEASAIGVLGGISGVILGWIVGRIINFGANWYIQSQGGTPGNLFSLPLWLISGAIAFSWIVSLAAGVYPAARAARLDPIQALRHD
jgi:putative ABC transport system permease protein